MVDESERVASSFLAVTAVTRRNNVIGRRITGVALPQLSKEYASVLTCQKRLINLIAGD